MIFYPEMQPVHNDFFNGKEILENIAMTSRLDLKEVNFTQAPSGTMSKVAVICPGSTIRTKPEGSDQTYLQIIEERTDVLKILAGSGHRFLNSGELNSADVVVANTPCGNFVSEFKPPRQDMLYYLASHCPAGGNKNTALDPDVFSHLINAGCQDNIRLWHAHIEGVTHFGDKPSIGTGSGAGVGALLLMAALGHREFEFYGCDGSILYAVDISDLPKYVAELNDPVNQVAIKIDGKTYKTHHAFWAQTEEIAGFLNGHPEIKVKFHGDSLNARIFNTLNGVPRRDFEIVKGTELLLPNPEPGGMG